MGNSSRKDKNSVSANPLYYAPDSSNSLNTSSSTIKNDTPISQPTTTTQTSSTTTVTASTTTTNATTATTTTTSPRSAPTKPSKPTPEATPKVEKPKSEKKIKSKKEPVRDGPDDFTYCLVIIGEKGVGKTSLLHRFTKESFSESIKPTEGIDFEKLSVMVELKKVGLEIWDTAGEERTRVPTTFYQDAKGVLAVYDVSDRESFENVKIWLHDAEKFAKGADAKWLIGNKKDISTQAVPSSEAREFAKSKGMEYYEVSAKSADNVDELFQNIGVGIKKQFNK